MNSNTAKLTGEEFFFAHVDGHLDGSLTPDERAQMDEILKNDSFHGLSEKFIKTRGHLQMNIQRFYLSDEEQTALHELVEPRTARETMEAQRIVEVSRFQLWSDLRRKIVFAVAFAAVVLWIVFYLAPPAEKKFDAIQYLGYEALAMEEEMRLDLPASTMTQVAEYLSADRSLNFQPTPLRDLGPEWMPEGAAIIDYEIQKVAVVQYQNSGLHEKLFHFMLKGKLDELPKSERFAAGKRQFQAYASDQINLVAWQASSETLAFLAGRRAAMELAQLATDGG